MERPYKIKKILDGADRIEYRIQKLKSASLLWIDSNNPDLEGFCERFAFADSSAACFRNIAFEAEKDISVSPERYGGNGIGLNGGGGRCANFGDVQLKGIGPNCLVGDHDNKVHSYGGLDARKAIVETLFTHILKQALPLGTINIRGLIFVGEDAGFDGHEDCWGVIMVRDSCIRPGHFLRAGAFKPQPEVEKKLLSDIGRVRRLYKELNNCFEGTNEFIKWIGGCLQNIAWQFSFAFAARIAHGTMTPSNISIDGRWLDLPDAGFLGSGTPFIAKNEFFAEHQSALKCFIDMVYHYSKYNGVLLNPAPLVRYYNERFDANFRYCVALAFGFKIKNLPFISSKSWSLVALAYSGVIHTWKDTMERGVPVTVLHDPVHALVIGSLLHCLDSDLAGEILESTGIHEQDLNVYLKNFRKIWAQYLEHVNDTCDLSCEAAPIRSLLMVFRNTLLAELFSPSTITAQVTELCSSGCPDQVGPFIDDCLDAANWVFSDNENSITIFRNHRLDINFSVSDGRFFAQRDGVLSYFASFHTLYLDLSGMEADAFILNGKDYSAWLGTLSKLMSSVTFKTSEGVV